MNMKAKLVIVSLFICAAAFASGTERPSQQNVDAQFLVPSGKRKFSIEYIGRITNVPPETKVLRVWFPVPVDSSVQKISALKFSPKARLTAESKYGNRIAYWEMREPSREAKFRMFFVCERRETKVDFDQLKSDGSDSPFAFEVYKKPDQLVVVDDEIKSLSNSITIGKQTSLEKARAIYDYVLAHMTYDKNHPGWGLGSTRHACDVGKGNCTDFHALFNSLCRAQGIASGFEIGLYLPYERNSNEPVGGYHCWAFFRVPGKTWVPVDCSEADRFPERSNYFFGNHTPNRVTLSTGRDLVLEPKQAGAPLNYFLNPYAEADGTPIKADKTWSYQDLD